jgi:hypothetical protein
VEGGGGTGSWESLLRRLRIVSRRRALRSRACAWPTGACL